MFSGGSRVINPQYFSSEQTLKLRPYDSTLKALTGGICSEIGLGGNETCLFETRMAFDCLARHRVTKMGDLTDNMGLCAEHISNMKKSVGSETKH